MRSLATFTVVLTTSLVTTSLVTTSLAATSATGKGVSLRPAQGFDGDPASDADFTKYALKGGALMCGLTGTDKTAGILIKDKRDPPSAASIWSGNMQDFASWYWHDTQAQRSTCKPGQSFDLTEMMNGLGLSDLPKDEEGDNACYRTEHWDPAKKDDKNQQVPAINQWYQVGEKGYRVGDEPGRSL
jgi:hypothetical protein